MKEILYSKIASKYLEKLSKSDKKFALKIIDTIEKYSENQKGSFDIKTLKGNLGDFFRLRVGDYRIIFDEDLHVIRIYKIAHRKEVYND